jgi:amino acid adenylation domain-containing protein
MERFPSMLAIPTDRARPAQCDGLSAALDCRLDAALVAGIRALSGRHGISVCSTLLAGLGVLLTRLSGQGELSIATRIAGRVAAQVQLDVHGSASVGQLLEQVAGRVAAALPARAGAAPTMAQFGFFCGTPPLATCDFSLSVSESADAIDCTWHYAPALFDQATAQRYFLHWRTLLASMLLGEQQRIDALELLSAPERAQILVAWNATDSDYAPDRCVHQLFEEIAARTPQAAALMHEGRVVSYGALNAQANRLARCLRAHGAQAGGAVAILMARSLDLIVAELAVLKCGAAYVPIDPAFPLERKRFMLADTAAPVLVTHASVDLPDLVGVARLDIELLALDAFEADNLAEAQDSAAPAYIMYTSGSTGQAKGVVVPHRAINRLVLNNGYARFEAADRVAFAANPAFDAATMELWGPLLNGGCCVVIGQETVLDVARFDAALCDAGVTVLWMTVGLFNQFAEGMARAIGALRYLIVGGEALNPAAIAGVLRRSPPQRLINGYGPTETTTFAITHDILAVGAELEPIPLGRPIANTQVYILDPQRRPVPIGVAGEIHIGGAGLALGYLNRPDLSGERFVADPFAADPARRMYRTGDLGKWRADGIIDYLGRNDTQVKIRGFRIELGEIETRLGAQPSVRGAVVLAREDVAGDKRLVAYVVLRDGGGDCDHLRAALAASMPDYMLPAAYVVLAELPLTPNGKLDRKALPAPSPRDYGVQEYHAPLGETETELAALWCQLLGCERVGRHDNFFRLGGHSLYATRLLMRVREQFEVELKLAAVFDAPVLAALAARILDAQLAQFDAGQLACIGVAA